ncbi:MAG: 30S ribosomal protein S15 [bacterium]
MLSVDTKKKIITQNRVHEADTGSPEVQVAILTTQIKELLAHLKKHPNDIHSKRGLLKMVAKRRKHLKYLKLKEEKRYEETINKMGLKK